MKLSGGSSSFGSGSNSTYMNIDPEKPPIAKRETKRFSVKGAQLLEQIDSRKLCIFEDQNEPLYKKRIHIKRAVSPAGLIISFYDDEGCANTVDERTHLLSTLARSWETKNQPFDMVRHFPGVGRHVIVSLNVDEHMEEDAMLLKSATKQPNGGQLNLNGNGVVQNGFSNEVGHDCIYHRGFVINVTAGKDIYSASYDVFLYDSGTLAYVKLDDIRLLTEEQRLMYAPIYRIFRVPGLFPLEESSVLVNLHQPLKMKTVMAEEWPNKTIEQVRRLLASHAIQLTILAEHGVLLYGDMKLLKLDPEKKPLDMSAFSDSRKFELYSLYLKRKNLAVVHEETLQNILLLDSEDEKNLDWLECAKIPDI